MTTEYARLLNVDESRWEAECRKAGHPIFADGRCWCGKEQA